MNVADHAGAGQRQQVVVTLEVVRPVGETLTAVLVLAQAVGLNHGTHSTVEHQDAFLQRGEQRLDAFRATHHCASSSSGRTPSAWQIAKASSERFSV